MTFKTASEVVGSVKELCSLPDIYVQLKRLTQKPQFALEDVARVIAQDTLLTARMLRIVNSPVYGFQSSIDTLTRAITVVGLGNLQNWVLVIKVMDRITALPAERGEMEEFWRRSVHCAVVCKLLANHCVAMHTDPLFLAGLLHDIGSRVLYQAMPDVALRLWRASHHDRRLLIGIEQTLLGYTHADVGKEMLKAWGFPEPLYSVVGDYPAPYMAQVHKLDAYILHLACRLLDNLEVGIAATDSADPFIAQARTLVRLSRQQLADIMVQAESDRLPIFDAIFADWLISEQ